MALEEVRKYIEDDMKDGWTIPNIIVEVNGWPVKRETC